MRRAFLFHYSLILLSTVRRDAIIRDTFTCRTLTCYQYESFVRFVDSLYGDRIAR